MNRRLVLTSVVVLGFAGGAWLLSSTSSPAQTEEAKKVSNLRKALEQTVTLEFTDISLEEVVDRLSAQAKIPVVLDSALVPLLSARDRAFALPTTIDAGTVGLGAGPPPSQCGGLPVDSSMTVIPPGFSCQLRQMRLGAALHSFLSHYGLGYALLGGTVVIATAERASQLQRRQPVSLAVENTSLSKALEMLSQAASVEIVLDPRFVKEARAPMTLKVNDVPLERAVQLLAELADLKAVALEKTFLITNPARADALRATQAKPAPVKMVKIAPQFQSGGLPAQTHNVFMPRGQGALSEVEVPAALLQTGGPAPRGGELDRKTSKVAVALKRPPTAAELTRKKLSEPMPEIQWEENMTLGFVLNRLEQKAGFPKFVMNQIAFKEDEAGVDPNEHPIKLPNVGGLSKARVLRLILDQIPTNNAAFLVRPDFIEILTNERSLPEMQFIEATFQDIPLDEALAQLADLSGLTILVDARAAEKAKTPVSARFQPETNLATAARLLADMADLKLVIVDRMLYITLRSNTATFPPGRLPGGKQRNAEAA